MKHQLQSFSQSAKNDSEEFTIKIKPDTTNAFEKKGSTVQNAQVIDWEIKINQELATHENASVEDFPEWSENSL